jgi:hypothetical protein
MDYHALTRPRPSRAQVPNLRMQPRGRSGLAGAQRLGTLGLALGLLACGDDAFIPTEETVAGTYTATTFLVTNTTPPTDLLALGMTLTLTLSPDGTTTGRLFLPGGGDNGVDLDEDLAGTWTLSGRSVNFDQSADTFVREAVFAVEEHILTTEGTFGDTSIRLVLTKAMARRLP